MQAAEWTEYVSNFLLKMERSLKVNDLEEHQRPTRQKVGTALKNLLFFITRLRTKSKKDHYFCLNIFVSRCGRSWRLRAAAQRLMDQW